MKKFKKVAAFALAAMMALSMTACGDSQDAGNAGNAGGTENGGDAAKTYTVGVCQLIEHPALDAATQGFQDALKEKLGDSVNFDVQVAGGDSSTCSPITNTFASNQYDLIMANGTAALQSAASSTADIPILGTSITHYGTALDITDWTGATGTNISGTSDLAPLDGQATCVKELFPDAKKVGILYCSAEANSQYQAEVIAVELEKLGYETETFTFTDSNDIAQVTQSACDNSDVIYVPTDNIVANCAEAINNVALPAKTPIFAGESGICSGCGVATLSIDYYNLGYVTGEMAYEILVNGADPATMEIKFASEPTKMYNSTNASELGITIPDDYKVIE